MTHALRNHWVALASGALFGVGLVVSGMTRPQKVIGFLDIGGAWDASLALVMVAAIAVHFLAYRLIRRRAAPVWAEKFALPTRREIDAKLVLGAAVFGVGWGLGGYCPGPGVVSLGAGEVGALVFVGTMSLGLLAAGKLERNASQRATRIVAPRAEGG